MGDIKMSKTYSSKYFIARIKKHRLTLSREKGYKSIEKLFDVKDKSADLSINAISHGKEHEQ